MELAVTQDVEQGLMLIAAPLTPLASVAIADGAVEQKTVETGLMNETPVCEAC